MAKRDKDRRRKTKRNSTKVIDVARSIIKKVKSEKEKKSGKNFAQLFKKKLLEKAEKKKELDKQLALRKSPQERNWNLLNEIMSRTTATGYLAVGLLVWVVKSILSGSDAILEGATQTIQPLWVVGYRVTKQTTLALFNISTVIGRQWFTGAVIFSLAMAFPQMVNEYFGRIIGTVVNTFLNFTGLDVASMFGGISSSASSFSSAFVPALVVTGTLVNSQILTDTSLAKAVINGFSDIIGVPFAFAENTVSEAMEKRWKRGGYKGILSFVLKICLASTSLWLLTPTIKTLLLKSNVPNIYNDIMAFISSSTLVTEFSESFVIQNFLKTLRFTISSLGLDNVFPENFAELISGFVDFFNGEKIRVWMFELVEITKPYIDIGGIYTMIWGEIKSKKAVVVTVEAAKEFFKDQQNLLVPSAIYFALGKGSVEDFGKVVNSSSNSGDIVQLYSDFQPGRLWLDLNNRSTAERFQIVFRLLTKLFVPYFMKTVNFISGSLMGIIGTLMFMGVAWWFVAVREPLDIGRYERLIERFSTVTIIFDNISSEFPNILEMKFLIGSKTDNEYLNNFKNVLGGDLKNVYKEYFNVCFQLQADFRELLAANPVGFDENELFMRTIPSILAQLSSQVSEIELKMLNGRSTRTNKEQLELQKTLERAAREADDTRREKSDIFASALRSRSSRSSRSRSRSEPEDRSSGNAGLGGGILGRLFSSEKATDEQPPRESRTRSGGPSEAAREARRRRDADRYRRLKEIRVPSPTQSQRSTDDSESDDPDYKVDDSETSSEDYDSDSEDEDELAEENVVLDREIEARIAALNQ